MKKKKILIHSNFCKVFTGFGKHTKNLLSYLYKTGKYELVELSNGFGWNDPQVKSTPWESYGSLPEDPAHQKAIMNDESRKNAAGYGSEMIDYAIKTIQPDIYLGIEDIWAFRGFFDKPWWNKLNCIIHTTLDSLPILPDAIEAAPKIKNYFVWASFAEKALNKLGHNHVKSIKGSVDTSNFFKLKENERSNLRKKFNLSDDFIIGFVFRNQLRKSAPNLLDGFKLFKQQNPDLKTKLLLHTHWGEGWNIQQLIQEKSIDPKDILTTYFCNNCYSYEIKPFLGRNIPCRFCNSPNTCDTTNVKFGVNEQQLNEIYNLMDVYCHPFTSGGQELPIQEAKLTELITLVTNYSCGEDSCSEESGGLPLEWSEYREPGTQFIKATTSPISISDQLNKVYKMDVEEKTKMQKKSRQYVIDNYSIEKIGKMFENLFDTLPEIDREKIFSDQNEKYINFKFQPNNNLTDKDWIESLYENMLGTTDPHGVGHWMHRLKTDLNRETVLNEFKKASLQKQQEKEISDTLKRLKEDNKTKKIAYIEPSGAENVLIASSILPSIKKLYPDHEIYFFTQGQYKDLINSHDCVKETISYLPMFDDILSLEGKGSDDGCFEIVFSPYLTFRNNNFSRNDKDKLEYVTHEY